MHLKISSEKKHQVLRTFYGGMGSLKTKVTYLDQEVLHRYTDRIGDSDLHLITWPPRYRELTPSVFFVQVYIKDTVYGPSVANTLQKLKKASVSITNL